MRVDGRCLAKPGAQAMSPFDLCVAEIYSNQHAIKKVVPQNMATSP
jgi:hypothetical protein